MLGFFEFLKVQQLVSIVFVLFLMCFKLNWKAVRKVVAKCVEAVENVNDALLNFNMIKL